MAIRRAANVFGTNSLHSQAYRGAPDGCKCLRGQPGIPPAGLRGLERGSSFMPTSEWQVEVDRWTPDEWSQTLDLFNDANVYQTWSYGQVRWGRKT